MRMYKYLLIVFLGINMPGAGAQQKSSPLPIKIGMAGWTFHQFSLDTTLEVLQQLDVNYLCVKDFHLPLNSTVEEMDVFREKLAKSNVIPYGVGPIYMRNEEQVDNAFAYAERLGVKLVIGVPDYELLPYVEQAVQKYDIKIAIHLHGPGSRCYPNATDIWDHVKDMDPRMGICLDVGHNLRDAQDPIEDYLKYHTRVFDIHIKDVTEATRQGHGIEFGRGLINFPKLAQALVEMNYQGVCSLEYEKDMENPFMGVAHAIGYFQGVCADGVK